MNRDIVYVAGLLCDQAQSSQRAGTFVELLPDLTTLFAGAMTTTLRELTVQVQLTESDGPIYQQTDR
jgi:hypothetical protein